MKRVLAVVILLALALTSLAGCGNVKKEVDNSPQTTQAAKETKETSEAKKDPVTIKIFIPENTGAVTYRDDFPAIVELGKRTNVNIQFIAVPAANFNDKFNLSVSSGDMPDVMVGLRTEINKYGMSGAFVALDELIDKNAPNLKSFLDKDPMTRKKIKASDGKIYAIPKWTFLTTTTSNFIRKDWLDKLNLKVPETVDEMVNVLKAFRDNDPNGNQKKDEIPYSTRGGNITYMAYAFINPFGIADDFGGKLFTLENKKIIYGPIDPRYKESLKLLNSLYKDNLIDKEFATIDGKLYDAKVSGNQIGSLNYWIGSTLSQNEQMGKTIPGFEWVGVPALKGPTGVQKAWNAGDEILASNNACITIKNKNPMETLKLFDYIYGKEGSMLINWGIEGVHYNMENGNPKLSDSIMKNAKYPNKLDAMFDAGLTLGIPFIYDERAWTQISNSAEEIRIRTMYREKYLAENVPVLPFSKEENDEITKIMKDISTYKQEKVVKFIMGTESLDKFDEYVKDIKKMGIDKVLEIYNNAYQKYMAN